MDQKAQHRVRDYMTRNVITLHGDTARRAGFGAPESAMFLSSTQKVRQWGLSATAMLPDLLHLSSRP